MNIPHAFEIDFITNKPQTPTIKTKEFIKRTKIGVCPTAYFCGQSSKACPAESLDSFPGFLRTKQGRTSAEGYRPRKVWRLKHLLFQHLLWSLLVAMKYLTFRSCWDSSMGNDSKLRPWVAKPLWKHNTKVHLHHLVGNIYSIAIVLFVFVLVVFVVNVLLFFFSPLFLFSYCICYCSCCWMRSWNWRSSRSML